MILCLKVSSNFKIEDLKTGQIYSTKEAKKLWQAGKITDCNLSFQRLVNYNFNLARVKKFYKENK